MRLRSPFFPPPPSWALAVLSLCCSLSVARAQATDCVGDDIPETGPVADVHLTFDHVYTGSYRQGEPYDTVTIRPDGAGETFEEVGITLRLQLSCGELGYPIGPPLAGIPADRIVLYSGSIYFCEPKTADHDTDAEGWTEFSGTIAGGGCSSYLDLYVEGIFTATLPIRINSPDWQFASPGYVDVGDLSALSGRLGNPSAWDLCFDYNESGPPTIDAADLAYFASALGASCR